MCVEALHDATNVDVNVAAAPAAAALSVMQHPWRIAIKVSEVTDSGTNLQIRLRSACLSFPLSLCMSFKCC